MTIEKWVANIYRGVAADVKPTTGVENGALFLQTDDFKVFLFKSSDTTWNEITSGGTIPTTLTGKTIDVADNSIVRTGAAAGYTLVHDGTKFSSFGRGSAYNVLRTTADGTNIEWSPNALRRTEVYKIGSTYYAENASGGLVSSSGTLETVLQAALDLGGTVNMEQPGTYTFNTIGVKIPTYTTLRMGYSTILSPPAVSSGFVMINIGKHANNQVNHSRHCQVFGGRLVKNTGEQDWTAIELSTDADANGNAWTVIQDVIIYWPGTGIKIGATSTGWCSNFNINRTVIYYPLIGVDFMPKVGTRDTPFRAKFDDVSIQSLTAPNDPSTFTQFGFKNVYYKDISFYNCNVWDLGTPANQKTISIAAGAYDIKIKGGTLARNDIGFRLVDNSGIRGISIEADDWNLPKYGTEPMTQTIFPRLGRRKGGWEATAGAGSGWSMTAGAWTNHAVGGSGGAVTPTFADGTAHRAYPTGSTSGNGAGIRYGHLITCRGWNPVYKIRFRLHLAASPGAQRLLFGWLGSTTLDISTSDDTMNALHGCALSSRGADTNFRIASNNGTGGTTSTDTGIAMDTAIHTFELAAQDDLTNKWKWSIDGIWNELTTTDIPSQGAGLAPYAQISTSNGVAKGVDIFGIYVESA